MRTRGPTDYRNTRSRIAPKSMGITRNTRTTASSRNIDRGQRRQYRQSLA